MREIKFRVFKKETGIMYYPEATQEQFNHYLQIGSGGFWLYDREGKLICTSNWGDILMQFTGLKDKSGIDIYEGDVLRGFQKDQKDKDGKHGFDTTDTVYWRNGGFKAFGKSLQDGYTKEGNILYQFMWCNPGHFATPDHYCQLDDIEIIGNIHDVNPAGGQSSVDNMLHDPNVKAEEATNEQATEQQAAAESAAQDAATGASESAEEGGIEG